MAAHDRLYLGIGESIEDRVNFGPRNAENELGPARLERTCDLLSTGLPGCFGIWCHWLERASDCLGSTIHLFNLPNGPVRHMRVRLLRSCSDLP
jgi:hypothetical protein